MLDNQAYPSHISSINQNYQNHAEICPICKGTGKYGKILNYTDSTSFTFYKKTCHGCKGKGWITVYDN